MLLSLKERGRGIALDAQMMSQSAEPAKALACASVVDVMAQDIKKECKPC